MHWPAPSTGASPMRSRRRRVPSCRARAGGGKADEADGAHGAHHAGRQRRGDAEDEGAAGQEPEPEAARRFLVEGEQGRRAYQQDRANGHAAFRATEQFSHVAGGVGCMGIGIARAGEDGEALHRCAALQPGALLLPPCLDEDQLGRQCRQRLHVRRALQAHVHDAGWRPRRAHHPLVARDFRRAAGADPHGVEGFAHPPVE